MAEEAMDPTDHLPLQILRSDTIPPAPNRSEHGAIIDWLPDFAGYSWVAYGASSLLVITHFPSPVSYEETLIGSVFRQVFELSGDNSSLVTSVSWSLVGAVAAAAGRCVYVFSHDSESSKGSFCWSQTAVLVQSTKVEAVKWTGSGDGIIAGGIEVVLWKNMSKSWEIAWKFKTDQPQTLVSTTWFIDGPSATAAYPSRLHIEGSSIKEVSKSVIVCHGDGKHERANAELCHPAPVVMIQWRPLKGKQLNRDVKHSARQVLLTCCSDGTVRLWSEIDNGRVRKVGQDINDQKVIRRSYYVVSLIEINQTMNGSLGADVFVTWPIEKESILKTGKGDNQVLSKEGCDNASRCEWLIGFGPGMLATFWAIHCLDDISPMRFPRITLWKRQELRGLEVGHLHAYGVLDFKDPSLISKVVISRNHLFGPPTMCSVIHLLPCNFLVWSQLYTQTSSNLGEIHPNRSRTDNHLSCSAGGVLNLDGHTGQILQIAVHPYICEVELAVSLDSNGSLLFWLLSTISNNILGLPTLIPSWKICGKHETKDLCSKYTSLRWVPSILNGDRVLLMGHVEGIDCFIIKISQREEENIVCHKLCTISFTDHGPRENGSADIFPIPLPSTCNKPFNCIKFMLLGVWMKGFQALSWEITLHCYDLSESLCECNIDINNTDKCCMHLLENTFSGKKYYVGVEPCSSQLPDPHARDVSSFAVVCPGSPYPSLQHKWASNSDLYDNHPAYIMATGCSDGGMKLWRNKSNQPLTLLSPYELVGMFGAHHTTISAISLTDCGRKIATICTEGHSGISSTLNIWNAVHLIESGGFMLEDTKSIDGDVVALRWLAVGNGHLLLGVCTQNELQLYAPRRYDGHHFLNLGKSLERHIWFRIAFSHISAPIRGFLWGPRASALVVHDNYFCLFSQWLFLTNKNHQVNYHPHNINDKPPYFDGGIDNDIHSATFTDGEICHFKDLAINNSKESNANLSFKINMKKDHLSNSLIASRAQLKYGSDANFGFWAMLDITEKLCGALPVYHPEVLLMNIYSGNWKHAYVALRHLVDSLSSNDASEMGYIYAKPSHIVPQIPLSNYFEGHPLKSLADKNFQWNGDSTWISSSEFQRSPNQIIYNSELNASNNTLSSSSSSELSGFAEPLEKFCELSAMTKIEKIHIFAVMDLLGEISNSHSASVYESLDELGRRFWVAVRFQQLHFSRRFGRLASLEELIIDSRLIVWAFHSDCQEILLGSVLPNEPSWQEMRTLGIGFWFTNALQLRARMEKLARSQYLKKKDPKDCALLYIALNRLQVLAGLFKISKNEKDKPLVGFLSRNFQEEKNKAAALKNAYVLMGTHQLELAIAFFLLGGDPASAITVCAKNLGDEQLALVLCRLLEERGGPLERQLITKFMLPSAIEKSDYWLASLLEWEMGNYSQSFLCMLGFGTNSVSEKSALVSNQVAFLDPSIGLYCQTLATKNSMRNAVGEQNAALLARWATLVTATALNRCGLPLEALECCSSSVSIPGGIDQWSVSDNGCSELLPRILKPHSSDSSNWLLGDVAFHLESCAKLGMALQYFSKLVREHPSWPNSIAGSVGVSACYKEYESHQYETLLDNFRQKFYTGLTQFEQKFSLVPACLINMILLLFYNNGLVFVGYDIIQGYTSPSQHKSGDEGHAFDNFFVNAHPHELLFKATEETVLLFLRFIAACGISKPYSCHIENLASVDIRCRFVDSQGIHNQGVLLSLWTLRAAFRIFSGSFSEDLTMKALSVLDLFAYYVNFASAWLQRNSKALILMVQPLVATYTNGHTTHKVDKEDLKKILHQITDLVVCNSSIENAGGGPLDTKRLPDKQDGDSLHSIPDDERWQIVAVCLWLHMSKFVEHELNLIFDNLEHDLSSGVPLGRNFSCASSPSNHKTGGGNIAEQIRLLSFILARLLKTTNVHISSFHIKKFVSFLLQKIEYGLHVPTLTWLEDSSKFQPIAVYLHLNQGTVTLDMMADKDEGATFEMLWDICADPKIIYESLMIEKIDLSHYFNHRACKGWSEIYRGILGESETGNTHNHEGRLGSSSAGYEAESPSRGVFRNGHTFLSSWQKDTTLTKEITDFENPKEIYKRNGELFEALSINSVDQRQVALASNRKGIIFFDWEDGIPFRTQSDCIWSEADWPRNGWAGSESTPDPTCVSPGISLGSKKGAHLGLGGATIGVGSLALPGRDLTGLGAFPGYAGIGASGMGWEIQEDFEEFVDPPATVENISTRAVSSHPCRPFFLVGSSNTHIYLWEFGKDKATATYGVLPAANVPPPYALASISALQFDYCGHRFSSAALDGTVCTWQLEVGGRSNIRPTESTLCFNNHASDVTYITSSGSIIAAAGHSSNGVNVVIWDTLAPPATSRASIICHEGGARSISVFDNNLGSGSVSPLIVTGGKAGDVGLHDFRYIATGKTKRHRPTDNGEQFNNASSSTDMQTGTANKSVDQNGMLWYIPKAHLGSVTKISTIPNTSLFLTGSKDGDVKLWDAKKAKLVYHWQKLHERHTFLQPSSRGFGGVVRAAVTDIQVFSHGFLTCGGDGSVKLVQLKDYQPET